MGSAVSLTCVLSGPVAGRSPLLSLLQRAGLNLAEQDELRPTHGLPSDPDTGWVTVLAPDLPTVEKALARSGWQLRLHWPTPDCRACAGKGKGQGGSTCLHCLGAGQTNKPYRRPDPLIEMQKRLDKLERQIAQGQP